MAGSRKASKKGSRKASKKGSKKSSKKTSSRGRKMTWIKFVKKYQKEHNVSYADALSKAKTSWKAYKREHGMD